MVETNSFEKSERFVETRCVFDKSERFVEARCVCDTKVLVLVVHRDVLGGTNHGSEWPSVIIHKEQRMEWSGVNDTGAAHK